MICEGLEILFSVIDFPESIYRLLAIRYFFLFWLGWQWVQEGIKINWLTILLSLFSLFSILYFEYFSVDDEPWFYTTGWKCHRWPCYFFATYGLTAFLYVIWQWVNRNNLLSKFVKILAASSYEIFLVQMSAIFLTSSEAFMIDNKLIRIAFYIFFIWLVSIGGGIIIYKTRNVLINRKTQNNMANK